MKPELPFDAPLIHRALDAEAALARAHEARQRGELALALEHALAARAMAPIDGLRTAAGWLACFCHFRLGQSAPLLTLGPDLLPQVQDAPPRLALLRWLVLAHAEQGQIDAARRLGAEAMALADALDAAEGAPGADPDVRIGVHLAMAQAHLQAGEPGLAEAQLLETLPLAESQPLAYPLLATLQTLAEALLDQAHLAVAGLDRAAPGLGHAAPGLGHAASGLARAASGLPPSQQMADHPGDPAAAAAQALQRAADHARRAQAVAQRVGDAHYHALVDGLLGEALLHLGQADAAGPRLERALAQAQALGQPLGALRTELALAEARLQRGQPRGVLERLDAGLAAAEALSAHRALPLQLRLARCMGRAAAVLGQHERAARHQADRARWLALSRV